jgi:hypothetical protein
MPKQPPDHIHHIENYTNNKAVKVSVTAFSRVQADMHGTNKL